jgi:hypothetical protein
VPHSAETLGGRRFPGGSKSLRQDLKPREGSGGKERGTGIPDFQKSLKGRQRFAKAAEGGAERPAVE